MEIWTADPHIHRLHWGFAFSIPPRVGNARFYGEAGPEITADRGRGRILFHMGIGSLEVVIIANGGTHVTG